MKATPVGDREMFDPIVHVKYPPFYSRTPHNVSYLVFRTARGTAGGGNAKSPGRDGAVKMRDSGHYRARHVCPR